MDLFDYTPIACSSNDLSFDPNPLLTYGGRQVELIDDEDDETKCHDNHFYGRSQIGEVTNFPSNRQEYKTYSSFERFLMLQEDFHEDEDFRKKAYSDLSKEKWSFAQKCAPERSSFNSNFVQVSNPYIARDSVEILSTTDDNQSNFIPYDGFSSTALDYNRHIVSRLASNTLKVAWFHVPFPHTSFYPIGCTRTHAFGVIQNEHGFIPVRIKLSLSDLDNPFFAQQENREFKQSWEKRLCGLNSFYGGCAYEDNVCVIDSSKILIFDLNWKTTFCVEHAAITRVTSCAMNNNFLVIVGKQNTSENQFIWIYERRDRGSLILTRSNTLKSSVLSVKLFEDNHKQLIFINFLEQKGYTAIYEIVDNFTGAFVMLRSDDETAQKKRWELKKLRDVTLFEFPEKENINFTKQLSDGTIIQVADTSISRALSSEKIFTRTELLEKPVDVIRYGENILAVHNVRHSVRFFDNSMNEVGLVTSELLLGPMVIFQQNIPFVEYQYDSMVLFSDQGHFALLLTCGCLCVIFP